MADDIKAVVQRMIDAGESEENIGTVIKHLQSQGQPQGDHYKGPDTFLGGAAAGLKNYASDALGGFGEGLKNSPVNLAKNIYGMLQTAGNAVAHPLDTASSIGNKLADLPRAVSEIPKNVMEDVHSASSNPAMLTQPMGDFVGQTALTAGAGAAARPAARVVGKGLQAAGNHPFAFQLAGAHQIMGGNPIKGVALAAAPDAMKYLGGKLEAFGTPLTEVADTAKVVSPVQGVAAPVPPSGAPLGKPPVPAPPPASGPLSINGVKSMPSDSLRAAIEKALGKEAAPVASTAELAAPIDAEGRALGGYAGPERRAAGGISPTGAERRGARPTTDQPMGLKPGFERNDVAQVAQQMQAENPNIMAEAEQMRKRAAEAGRPNKVSTRSAAPEPPGGGGGATGGAGAPEEWVPVRQSKSHRNVMEPELLNKGTKNDIMDVVGPEKDAYEQKYGVKVTSVKKVPKSVYEEIERQRKVREANYRGDAEILKRLKIIEALDQ